MPNVNEKPGKGIYMCVSCKQVIKIGHDNDKLPICPRCRCGAYMNITKE